MTTVANIFWFLLCGVREKATKAGAFGMFGTAIAFYFDVSKVFKNAVWIMAIVFTVLTLLCSLIILRSGRDHYPLTVEKEKGWAKRETKPELPTQLHFYRSLTSFCVLAMVMLVITGFGQIWAASHGPNPASEDSVSLFATLIPELRKLRGEVAVVHEDLGRIDQKLANVRRETSDDPRKELANMGILWTVDSFFDAIRRGDRRTVNLFAAGKMATGTPDSQGRPLPVMLALNNTNVGEMLDALVVGGLDVNQPYEISAPMGKQRSTLLSRAIEKGNLPLVEALIRHKVRTDEPIQTFGAMGSTRGTYPLASAIYWQQIAIAEALLASGADPGVGDYAAYREARVLRQKPNLSPAMAAPLDALIVRLAPKGMAGERIEAELRLQAVERQLNQIGLESIRAMRGSSEKAQLDQKYQSLQEERTRLRAQLGITDSPRQN